MTNMEKRAYNLIERTTKFAGEVLGFVKTIPISIITRPILSQLVRSATSVGANYHEAHDAESPSDFRHKIGICRKESRETFYWLQMLQVAHPASKPMAQVLMSEVNELNRIFTASFKTVSQNIDDK